MSSQQFSKRLVNLIDELFTASARQREVAREINRIMGRNVADALLDLATSERDVCNGCNKDWMTSELNAGKLCAACADEAFERSTREE